MEIYLNNVYRLSCIELLEIARMGLKKVPMWQKNLLLLRGSLLSCGLLGGLLCCGLLGSLLCCGFLGSLLGCGLLCGLLGSGLLSLLDLFGLLGLGLLDFLSLLGFLNLSSLELTSSLASGLSLDNGSGSKSLPEANLVVGHDILEDGLAG